MSVNTPLDAIKKSKTITHGYKGLCLQFVRTCYNIPAKYASAASAWANAKKKHSTTALINVPAGYPVFFSIPGNKYGHVALYLGDGNFRTNYSAKGTVITARLTDPVFRGMKMLGWSEDLNGVNLKKAEGGVDPKIKAWQSSMNMVFPAYADFAKDGKFGPYSEKVTKIFQERVGLPTTGKLDTPTVKAMRKYGVNI